MTAPSVDSDYCIRRITGPGGMALGQYPQVAQILVAVLHAVFEEVAVTDVVVSHIVLNPDIVRTMYRHAATEGVMNR